MGRKKAPIYKLVATDSRSKRDGRFIEAVGIFNPLAPSTQFTYKEDRILYWLNTGAEPTGTVRNLLSKEGLLMKRRLIERVGAEQAEVKVAEWKAEKAKPAAPKKVKEKKAKAESAE